MRKSTKLVLVGSVLIVPILIAAGPGEATTSGPGANVAALVGTSRVPAGDCFACYEGGMGNPVICTPDDHFDKPNMTGNFMGTPHGDEECIPAACEEDHTPFCEPGGVVAAVATAIRSDNLDALEALWQERKTIRLDAKTASLRVLDCQARDTVAQFKLTRAQLARLMVP